MSAEGLIIKVLESSVNRINESNIDKILQNWAGLDTVEKLTLRQLLIDKSYPFTVGYGYPSGENPRINYVYISEGSFEEREIQDYVGQDAHYIEQLPGNTHFYPTKTQVICGRSETNILITASGFFEASILSKFVRAILIKSRTYFERSFMLRQTIKCHDIKYDPALVNQLVIRAITFSYDSMESAFSHD